MTFRKDGKNKKREVKEMKRKVFILTIALVLILTVLFIGATPVAAGDGPKGGQANLACITIQDGVLTDTQGNLLSLGYDQWGYNYQGHIFNGLYENYNRPNPPVAKGETKLQMKWNDAWLSNKSCDGDYLLDRHYGYSSYIGSGAWLTNHMWGENDDGSKYAYFVKIVAAPADATLIGGIWYTANGTEIGPLIWGEFAIIQEVESGEGPIYLSPTRAGLGGW